MAGYTKTYTLDFTASGDTVYTGTDKLEDDIDDIITWINAIKKSYASASAPTSPAPDEGQLWYDSTNDELHVYNGSSWGDAITDTHKVKADSGDGTEGYLNAKVQNSITVDETNHKLHLSNDSASPGNNYVYGTSAAGAKGWRTTNALPNLLCGVSSNDSTPGYLNGKLVAGSNVSLTEGSDGGDETLTIAALSDATAGNYIESLDTTEYTTNNQSYTEMQAMYIPRDGEYRFFFWIKYTGIGGHVYGKIYRNGVAVGTEKVHNTTSYQAQTDDISGWSAGDTAEIWIHRDSNATSAELKNFIVASSNPMVASPDYTNIDLT